MGFEKRILKAGNGTEMPTKGDTVTLKYTGYIYDESKPWEEYRGKIIDTTFNRDPFETQIGMGKVIKGWDEGIPTMTVGENSVLTISSDYAYGDRGFYNLIPPNSQLIFEVELIAIKRQDI